MRQYLTYLIEKYELPVAYEPRDSAPMSENELFNEPTIKIWTGASDGLIWLTPQANWKFRAIHDLCHINTRLNFSVEQEIELGRIQANIFAARCQDLLAEVTYCEIAGQAAYYGKTGKFVDNQLEFTLNWLNMRLPRLR